MVVTLEIFRVTMLAVSAHNKFVLFNIYCCSFHWLWNKHPTIRQLSHFTSPTILSNERVPAQTLIPYRYFVPVQEWHHSHHALTYPLPAGRAGKHQRQRAHLRVAVIPLLPQALFVGIREPGGGGAGR